MLPLAVFRNRAFTATNSVTFLLYGAFAVALFLLGLVLQGPLGYSPLRAGLATLPVTILMLLFSARAGALGQRIGPRIPMTLGPLLVAAGLLAMTRIDVGATYVADVLPGVVVFGARHVPHRRPAHHHRAGVGRRAPHRHRLRRQQRRRPHRPARLRGVRATARRVRSGGDDRRRGAARRLPPRAVDLGDGDRGGGGHLLVRPRPASGGRRPAPPRRRPCSTAPPPARRRRSRPGPGVGRAVGASGRE